MALLLLANGESRELLPANGRSFELRELQTVVGGFIEAVYMPGARVLFCNEDGKRLGLPLNQIATVLTVGLIRPDDVIVGDAIICSRQECGEDDEAEE